VEQAARRDLPAAGDDRDGEPDPGERDGGGGQRALRARCARIELAREVLQAGRARPPCGEPCLEVGQGLPGDLVFAPLLERLLQGEARLGDGQVDVALRARVTPPPSMTAGPEPAKAEPPKRPGTYRPWAELLKRTFDVDVLECGVAQGRRWTAPSTCTRRSVRAR
jgi:hypothetical protein